MTEMIVETLPAGRGDRLSRWRINSPFIQTLLVGLVFFCVPGLNTTVFGLGAGGSRPENIQIVDKVNIVGASTTVVFAFFGGSCVNQIGPRNTMLLAVSGYPAYTGSLWSLDKGQSPVFAYIAAIWHGISAALLYSAAGYVVSSYSPEDKRARYIASIWLLNIAGATIGASVVLGITSVHGGSVSHVPPAVYISIISIQCVGVGFAALLKTPAQIRRNDGRAIATFKALGWKGELAALPKALLTPRIGLLALGIVSSQMPLSFAGSTNATYFNARTRALVNLCLSASGACGWACIVFLCDSKWLGFRRRRALIAGAFLALVLVGVWSGSFWFLTNHSLDRSHKVKAIRYDWGDGSSFVGPLLVYVLLGFSFQTYQGYHIWLCNTFSNDPSLLGRFSGYIEAMRALGLAIAFGIDSNGVKFMTEGQIYFTLLVVGLGLSVTSAFKYTKDSLYGEEEAVIVPEAYEVSKNEKMDESEKMAIVRSSDVC